MRSCSKSKSSPRSVLITISPSSTHRCGSRADKVSTSSGKYRLSDFWSRLWSRISSPSRKTRARKPSHFGSNTHPSSAGNSLTRLASMGRTGGFTGSCMPHGTACHRRAMLGIRMPLDPRRTISDLKQLRALTGNDQGAQRIAWSETWLKARAWFQGKLAQLPVEHHLDAAGNSWTTLRGDSEQALILGSHLDSVPNGGWLDGALGVLTGLEFLQSLAEDHHGKPPVTIRLVDWADEEGARFGRSLFGSSAFAGTHTIEADRSRADRDGITLEAALRNCGVEVDRIGD